MLAKKFALGFGIAILLPMLVCYGVRTFNHVPNISEVYGNAQYFQEFRKATPEQRARLEQARQMRQQDYQNSQEIFQKDLFFVAVPVGLLSILCGVFNPVQAIGTGLMFGGIFTLVEGYFSYWSQLEDGMRFLSLLLAFGILIYIGYRKLGNA